MDSIDKWLLPEGAEEILPEEAYKLETLRRRLLDLYEGWGYELVVTPLVEFLESLLVGPSQDLDVHTCKITDQISGRMMGVRADMTPQVARIDAHCLNRQGPVRLCYADTVMHTKPRGLLTSRLPFRVGAEFFGEHSISCDVELVCLMLETLSAVEVKDVQIVLGHVGIYRSLVQAAAIGAAAEAKLHDAVQRKAYDEIDEVLSSVVDEEHLRSLLGTLTRLSGDESILLDAVQKFSDAPLDVKEKLEELTIISEAVKARTPEVVICFDLCELRGYDYHTGIVFAAYTPAYGRAIAKGGRYDSIGEVFGRSRPASGFDTDLKTLVSLSSSAFDRQGVILAPVSNDPKLSEKIMDLRSEGRVVISCSERELQDEEIMRELRASHTLVLTSGEWVVS
ncbi:ATP phosphoribosyltransferase regulatory subunit [bacterium]|nr:ATP phosphoribosyltransferase regulatory subunit [bacterium]MDB2444085.1 ATP phosphoribosyltransferase regulatory subunit [Gammaproteobacteria bacterium]MDC3239375.1 ATP phosphoribosyltransferase regulatory subunit [Gammaproteobacteria bacterium]